MSRNTVLPGGSGIRDKWEDNCKKILLWEAKEEALLDSDANHILCKCQGF